MIRVAADGTLTLATTAQVLVEPELVDHAVQLRYTPADPFAVGLCFTPSRAADADTARPCAEAAAEILWRLDRRTLAHGHAIGDLTGDVRVTRLDGLGIVVVELAPASVAATLVRFRTRAVDEFLDATCCVVPYGAERLEIDGLIRQLLGRP